jgi:lysophospholipase L1-like esterase
MSFRLLSLICFCLGSVSGQAQHVTYTSTGHYNKRVAQFEREGGITEHSIVMLGNSLTENGKDWAERLSMPEVVNRGIIGDNTVGMSERLCQITPFHPKAIFLMAGINDMSNGTPVDEVASRVISLIGKVREQSPESHLYVESLLPINESSKRWRTLANRTDDIPLVNMYVKAYCESHDIVFVDLFHLMTYPHSNTLRAELSFDGLHITEEGYRIWASELQKILNDLPK